MIFTTHITHTHTQSKLGVLACFSPSPREAEADGPVNLRLGLHGKTLSQNKTNKTLEES